MNILFAASEASPYVKSGGLGDVAGSLPLSLSKIKENNVCVIIPLYGKIKNDKNFNLEFVSSFFVSLSWRNVYAGLFKAVCQNGLTYYFIDNDYYFLNNGYGYYNDGERFAFFSKAILEAIPFMDFTPDIIHLNDWQTAFVPLFLKAHFIPNGLLTNLKTILTIHNIEYQGKANPDFKDDVLGVDDSYANVITFDGCVNALKTGIVLCDKLTTVSETYSFEIRHAYFAHGLENIINENAYKLVGITNGIDTSLFNPKTDKTIKKTYSSANLSGKQICKKHLQEKLGLEINQNIPIVSIISRLVSHKGIDLVEYVAEELINLGIQLVVLGTGEKKYEDLFNFLAYSYKGRVSSNITFSNELAKEVYSGSDFLLMPSKSEPCGLSQLIAMRYGTIPVVRETGGLVDTVMPINPETLSGNGFTFKGYNAHDMLDAVKRGIDFYHFDKKGVQTIKKNLLNLDFGWEISAIKYNDIYKSI